MKRLIGLALLFLLISSPGMFAQEDKQAGLEFDIVAAPVGLPLDGGEMSFGSTQPMTGISYPVSVMNLDFSPGLYVFGNIAAKNDDDPNWYLGLAAGIKIPVMFDSVVGFAYTFLREGEGGLPFKSANLAIILGITLN